MDWPDLDIFMVWWRVPVRKYVDGLELSVDLKRNLEFMFLHVTIPRRRRVYYSVGLAGCDMGRGIAGLGRHDLTASDPKAESQSRQLAAAGLELSSYTEPLID